MRRAAGAWSPWLWVDHLPVMGSQSLPPLVPPNVPPSTPQLLLPSHTHQKGMDTAGSGGQHAWGTAKPFPPRAGSTGVCSVGSCSGSTLSPNLTPLPHVSWCKGHNTLEVTPYPCWLGLWAYREGRCLARRHNPRARAPPDKTPSAWAYIHPTSTPGLREHGVK